MKVAIGCDHAGLELKDFVIKVLEGLGHEVEDMGTKTHDSVDYPDFAKKVAGAVSEGRLERGVLICGSGIGMSITANKFNNVRAAHCNDLYSAKMCRLHNDANLLTMGARIIGTGVAEDVVKIFFGTPFEGDRHLRRVRKIENE